MLRAPKHNKPFSSGGYKNKGKCFSSFAADDYFAPKPKARDPSRPQSSRPRSRRPQKPKPPSCDKNGCPQGTHRGKTSLRHKSQNGAWIGTGVPHGAAKMDYTKEYSWVPGAPSTQHADTHQYRDNGAKHNAKHITANGFRLGAVKDHGLFDKTVRVQACNGTFAPDIQMMQWVSGNRVDHARPFARSSYPQEDPSDRSFIGKHKHFQTGFNPYEEYEGQYVKTKKHHHHGFRPKTYTSSQATPWRHPSEHNPLKGTDRNGRLHATRAADGKDYHDGAGGRTSQWISSRASP